MSRYSEYFTNMKCKYFKMGSATISEVSTDGTLAGNSDSKIPTQKAIKTYVDGRALAWDAMVYKGVIACAGNPNYPAANAGEVYIVSTAGKIGGVSGIVVQVGDMVICNTDGTTSGDEATKGTYWNIIQTNTGTLYTAETSVTDNTVPRYDGTTGTLIQDSPVAIDDNGSINIPSGQTYKINNTAITYTDVGAAASGHTHSGVYIPVVTTGTAAPATTPGAVGLFFLDTSGKKAYVSMGTSASSDWVILN